jgi:hypothetical protein
MKFKHRIFYGSDYIVGTMLNFEAYALHLGLHLLLFNYNCYLTAF